MSKTIAPLLSFGAAGQLAKTSVYATWKGIPYVRRYTIPANPRTSKQMVTRLLFKKLQTMWLLAPALLKAPFAANAQGRPYTANNKFTSLNVTGIDTSSPPTDMNFFQGSPGAKGGLPPASLVITPGSGSLSCAVGAPVIPTGWTIYQAQGVCFDDQDPQTPFTGTIEPQFDATAPYTLVFTGRTAAAVQQVSVWFEWVRPDGSHAFGTSLTDQGTPT